MTLSGGSQLLTAFFDANNRCFSLKTKTETTKHIKGLLLTFKKGKSKSLNAYFTLVTEEFFVHSLFPGGQSEQMKAPFSCSGLQASLQPAQVVVA